MFSIQSMDSLKIDALKTEHFLSFSAFDPAWIKTYPQHDERGMICALCQKYYKSSIWVKTTSMCYESSVVREEAITKENHLRGGIIP